MSRCRDQGSGSVVRDTPCPNRRLWSLDRGADTVQPMSGKLPRARSQSEHSIRIRIPDPRSRQKSIHSNPRRRTNETTAAIGTALMLAAACGSDSPTTPSGNTGPIIFTAQLSAANEVPPITNADANARGTVTITFNVPRDRHRRSHRRRQRHLPGAAARLPGRADHPATPTSTPAHPGSHGGVLVDTDSDAGSPDHTGRNGAGTITFNDIRRSARTTRPTSWPTRPASTSTSTRATNPGGAVRGQLVRQ